MVAGEISRPVDVLVIGGGPGGYTAAARAAELGRDVVLIEADRLGGTCLNVGCIPSKALITLAHDLGRARYRVGTATGLVGGVDVDLVAAQRWKDDVVGRLRDGVGTLLRGVEVISGTARFVANDRVAVEAEDHVEHLQFASAVLASGSRPAQLAVLPVDQQRILDSTGALSLTEVPADLVVVGGGYIGVELGAAYAAMGTRVTIVELADRILGKFDDDVVDVVSRRLVELGMGVRTATTVTGHDDVSVHVEPRGGGQGESISATHVLVAVGRSRNTDDLQLEEAGLSAGADGRIAVDAQMRTAQPAIFAVGDITAGPSLAHKAFEQGRVAAEVICGLPSAFDQQIPIVAFGDPELAAVGLGEQAARAAGRSVVIGRGALRANGRALTLQQADGLVKLVVDAESGVLIGALVAAPAASELIGELTLAVECALRLDDLLGTIHVHPTLGEATADAARMAQRRIQRATR